MSVEAFPRGFFADFLETVFRNGYGDCGYAVRAAENSLSEHYKMKYLLL
jgi:hypothetical protein